MEQKKPLRFEDIEGAAAREWWMKVEAEGIEKGIKKGIEKTKIDTARNLLDILDDSEISKRCGLPIEVVQELRNVT